MIWGFGDMSDAQTIVSVPASSISEPHRGKFQRWLMGLFWTWYVASAIAFLRGPDGLSSVWPLSLSLVWWFVIACGPTLRNWVRRVKIPVWSKFFLIGLFFSDVVMENLAISFKGDLHPNLLLNSFLWFGAYFGVLLGWWLLSQRYALTPWQVFFIYGIKGVVVEQNFMVPLMIWKGQWFLTFLVIPFLTVVYGAAVAPVFVLLEGELPRPRRKLGWVAIALAVVVPMALFYAGAFVWFKLVEFFFGWKIPGQ